MEWLKQNHKKSQLGQLLLKKKLISEDQLNRAIDHQKNTGQRLGDIFTEWNLVTQRQIQGMLRKQRNVRRMATIVTALLAPLQVYAAAAAPVPVVQTQTSSTNEKHGSLRMLNEAELSEVVGQGVLDDTLSNWLSLNGSSTPNLTLQNLANGSYSTMTKQVSGLMILGDLLTVLDPLLGLLTAQTTMKDVVYNPTNAVSVLNPDGSITLSLPSSIGELSFKNIRVMGSTGPSFGSIDIKGINLSGTTVTLKAH
jgi:hypothetical protein